MNTFANELFAFQLLPMKQLVRFKLRGVQSRALLPGSPLKYT